MSVEEVESERDIGAIRAKIPEKDRNKTRSRTKSKEGAIIHMQPTCGLPAARYFVVVRVPFAAKSHCTLHDLALPFPFLNIGDWKESKRVALAIDP